MKRFAWLLLLVLVGISLILPYGVLAADDDWRINRFHSELSVQPDGKVKITESLDVTFQSDKHGLLRDIPYIYHREGQEDSYTNIEVWGVTRDDLPELYELKQANGYQELKIGNPTKTISGAHHYVITYMASGVLRSFADYDELYWNVTGSDWPVPIDQASATVTIPRQGILQTSCYQGHPGSTEICQSVTINSLESRFAATVPLQSGQNLTVAAGFTKGIVPILTVERPKEPIERLQEVVTNPRFVTWLIVAMLAGIAVPIAVWWRKGRDWSWKQPGLLAENQISQMGGPKPAIVAEFVPPDNLRPAQVGLIYDERVDTLDISSTIVDLAVRGYLTITELTKTGLFGSTDYQLDRTDATPTDLLLYEQHLLDKLFAGSKQVKLSDLKNNFYQDLASIKKDVYQDLMDKQYFTANPTATRTLYLVVGISIAIAGAVSFVGLVSANLYAWLPVAALVVTMGIGFGLLSQAMPQRSAIGTDIFRRVSGYRLFISTAERYKQQFMEKQNLFNEVLPYAMMFGLTHKFAEAMKVIGYEPAQPNWYTGTTAFNILAFSDGMNSMSRAMATTMASTPSSSGSGGGGFSGGGFGGGGGGSW